jgi:hypothetical protein
MRRLGVQGLKMLRRIGVPLAAIGLATMLVIMATHGSFSESLPVSVRVVSVSDSGQSGFITTVVVELANQSAHPLEPRFALVWKPQPARWRIAEGPARLEAHARAEYRLEPIGSVNAPPLGQDFEVRVNVPNSIVYAVSSAVRPKKQDLALKNPSLAWFKGDAIAPTSSPIGWGEYERLGAGDTSLIEPASLFGVDATHFLVRQDGKPDTGGWAHTGISQEIEFPREPLMVTVLSRVTYKTLDGIWPLNAFGIQVSDPANGLAWLLFENTGSGDREYDLPNGQHMKVYDVKLGVWERKSVDLQELYRKMNWSPLGKIALTIFVGASSQLEQDVEGYVAGIFPVSGASGQTAPR